MKRLTNFFKHKLNTQIELRFPNELQNDEEFLKIVKKYINDKNLHFGCTEKNHVNKKLIPSKCKCEFCTKNFDNLLVTQIINSTACTLFDQFIEVIINANRSAIDLSIDPTRMIQFPRNNNQTIQSSTSSSSSYSYNYNSPNLNSQESPSLNYQFNVNNNLNSQIDSNNHTNIESANNILKKRMQALNNSLNLMSNLDDINSKYEEIHENINKTQDFIRKHNNQILAYKEKIKSSEIIINKNKRILENYINLLQEFER